MVDRGTTELNPSELVKHVCVGTGITAEVFRGSYRGTEVAIKVINLDKSALAESDLRAFYREVAVISSVAHENLVQFKGVISVQKPFNIVSEFCHGGNVFDLLHNSNDFSLFCEWDQQLKMINDVANAMHYLHSFSPQIIHRDLKSLNLLLKARILTKDDIPLVKVSDFGLSRMKTKEDWGQMTKEAGTPNWMAPEVFKGGSYDEKVDIYSFAMIVFEIVALEIPFEQHDPAQIVKDVMDKRRPDEFGEGVPEDTPPLLRSLMQRCWAHEAHLRPAFSQIVEVLQSIAPPT